MPEKSSRTHSSRDSSAQSACEAAGASLGDTRSRYSRGPALERGDREQGHHSREDIVKVEIAVLPDPLTDHRTVNIPILVEDEEPPRQEKRPGHPSWIWNELPPQSLPHPGHQHARSTARPQVSAQHGLPFSESWPVFSLLHRSNNQLKEYSPERPRRHLAHV